MITYQPPPDEALEFLYIDDDLLIVNKPSGLLSVPGRGEGMDDCLVSRVQKRIPDALTVHRLDMDTSGLLLLARGAEMHRQLSRLFQDRKVDKRYLAVVDGLFEPAEGEINLPLICDWPNRPRQIVDFNVGKPSLTRFRRLTQDLKNATSRLELEPVTGRSHQLRVHLSALGFPILGDDLYGGSAEYKAERLLLHAMDLAFIHPSTATPLSFHCPAPF